MKIRRNLTTIGLGQLVIYGFILAFIQISSARHNSSPCKLDEEVIEKLISRLTLDEKLRMIGGVNYMESHAIERLGLPKMVMGNGPSGIRPWKTPNYSVGLYDDFYKATTFPAGIALAATWDREFIYRVAKTIGRESNFKGINVLLGPCVNIVRNPFSGIFGGVSLSLSVDSYICVSNIVSSCKTPEQTNLSFIKMASSHNFNRLFSVIND